MTKQEIKALVAAKIAGQGSMVDVGGGLPTILDAIIDLIPEVPEPYVLPIASADTLGGVKVGEGLSINEGGVLSNSPFPILEVTPFDSGDVTTEEELFAKIKLNGENITSIDDVRALYGKMFLIKLTILPGMILYPTMINEGTDAIQGGSNSANFIASIAMNFDVEDIYNTYIIFTEN